MPSLNKLWEENKDKGLHIFHLESQGHKEADVRKFCQKNKVKFPNLIGGAGFTEYKGDNGLPYAFVIGVDGTVVFQGRGDYKSVIHKELKKVRYPGLGKLSVHRDVNKAAGLFAQKKFAKALSASEKIIERADDGTDPRALADAQHVVARVQLMAERMQEKAEAKKAARDYDLLMTDLKMLEVYFKGHKVGKEAADLAKELRKDPEVKAELKALAALEHLLKQLERKDQGTRMMTLKAFADKFAGKRAAERALIAAKS